MALTVEQLRKLANVHEVLGGLIDVIEDEDVDDADSELENVIELIRKESVRAMQWGREADMQLLDGIIERLKRLEHRK